MPMSKLDRLNRTARSIVPDKQAVAVRLTALAALFSMAVAPAAAQQNVCATPIGDFTNGLITAALGLGLAVVLLALIISFGFRPIAFSRDMMAKLSGMSSNAILGLVGIVFVAVIFSWVLSYAPMQMPQGCVPLTLTP